MKVAVVKENAPGEQRVALVPETVPKLMAAGAEVLVETAPGEAAWFPDSAYAEAGAAIVTADGALRRGRRHPDGDPARPEGGARGCGPGRLCSGCCPR